MVDLSRRKRSIVARFATDADSISLLLTPAEALVIGEGLREYAEGA
jgi:hypothetical protein